MFTVKILINAQAFLLSNYPPGEKGWVIIRGYMYMYITGSWKNPRSNFSFQWVTVAICNILTIQVGVFVDLYSFVRFFLNIQLMHAVNIHWVAFTRSSSNIEQYWMKKIGNLYKQTDFHKIYYGRLIEMLTLINSSEKCSLLWSKIGDGRLLEHGHLLEFLPYTLLY